MRRFRHLPPLLRVADILALLVALAGLALLAQAFITHLSPAAPRWPENTLVIGLNLVILAGSCSFVDQAYGTRFRRRGGGGSPSLLGSWQSQVRAIALLAALPLCALTLAAVVPPTSAAFEIVFPVTLLGAVAWFGAYLWLNVGRRAID